MTQRYMHLCPAALDAAIRLLEQPSGHAKTATDTRSVGDILETAERSNSHGVVELPALPSESVETLAAWCGGFSHHSVQVRFEVVDAPP